MLSKDDKKKVTIMRAIRGGGTDDEILDEFRITSNTLTAIKAAYETIKAQLEEMSSTSEIAMNLDCSEEFIEEVKHLIETGEETPVKEAEDDEDVKQTRTKEKKGSKARGIDKNIKQAAEDQTAAVLVDDAGEISKGIAIQRQEIGRFVMEEMSTVAMQFGFTDIFVWLKDEVFPFWIKNQGRIKELEAEIQELLILNKELQEAVDLDILSVFIAKKLDKIMYASVVGGGALDAGKLHAYKQVLLTDPTFLKQLYDFLLNDNKKESEESGESSYGT